MGIEFNGNLDKFQKAMLRMVQERYPKAAKKLLRKLARETNKIARRKTRKGPTGNLKKGWKIGRFYKRRNSYWIVVKNIMPHAHLIEKGHYRGVIMRFRDGQYRTKKGTEKAGFVPGQHILEESFNEMERRFPREVEEFITKMIREEGL